MSSCYLPFYCSIFTATVHFLLLATLYNTMYVKVLFTLIHTMFDM